MRNALVLLNKVYWIFNRNSNIFYSQHEDIHDEKSTFVQLVVAAALQQASAWLMLTQLHYAL